jgi:hypothetical protein
MNIVLRKMCELSAAFWRHLGITLVCTDCYAEFPGKHRPECRRGL